MIQSTLKWQNWKKCSFFFSKSQTEIAKHHVVLANVQHMFGTLHHWYIYHLYIFYVSFVLYDQQNLSFAVLWSSKSIICTSFLHQLQNILTNDYQMITKWYQNDSYIIRGECVTSYKYESEQVNFFISWNGTSHFFYIKLI